MPDGCTDHVLASGDAPMLAPTGGGKSMQDQVAALRPRGAGGRPHAVWERRTLPTYRNLYIGAVKTTLDLNDTLLAEAKALAARQRTTLTRVVEEGLQLRLDARRSTPKTSRSRIPIFRGKGGLAPGLDPRSNKAMLLAADEDDA